MSDLLQGNIASIAEFLAHALELEAESAESYRELADNMQVHNNPEVAALFRELAAEGEEHLKQVQQLAASFELPAIAPWAFKWSCPDGPESLAMDNIRYLMTRRQALLLASHNEVRGRDFYAQVAEHSKDPEVRQLASKMAAEEDAHVRMLRAWLDEEKEEQPAPLSDLDPPNMPE